MAIRKRWDGETGVVDINFEFMVRLVDDAIDDAPYCRPGREEWRAVSPIGFSVKCCCHNLSSRLWHLLHSLTFSFSHYEMEYILREGRSRRHDLSAFFLNFHMWLC